MAKVQKTRKRRVKKNIARGCAHIHSTFNNTIVTITDESGNAVAWSSAGALGFKGSRKSTPYAAQLAGEAAGKAAMDHGMKTVSVDTEDFHFCREKRCSHRRKTGRRDFRIVRKRRYSVSAG